jgi:signal transduction histidine kinase
MKFISPVRRVCLCLALLGGLSGRAEPAVLRTARAVRELSAEEANRPHRAEIAGVVLGLAEPYGASLVVQDATDPIYVTGPADAIGGLVPGDMVEVRGATDAGGFAPYVRADEVRKTGTTAVPEPERISPEELFTQRLDAHWVSVTGVVRSVRDLRADEIPQGPDPKNLPNRPARGASAPERRMKMVLAMNDRLVPVQLYGRWDPAQLVDAEVEVHALCFNQHNTERQFLSPLLLIPRSVELRMLQPPPADPFAGPAVLSHSLFGFNRTGLAQHRVKVDGVVLHQVVGLGLWMRDDHTGLFVRSSQGDLLRIGDRVQTIGFPERGTLSPVLADAVFRRIADGPAPAPTPIADRATAARHNGDLVAIEGVLAGQKETDEGLVLRVDWQGTEVPAIYRRQDGDAAALPALEPGSVLSVAGICVFSSADQAPLSGVLVPQKFSLLLRHAADVAVLRPAPWWTGRRLAALLVGAVVALAAILVAVFVVSRRKLARERARRAAAIAEYRARLAERSGMARELHDVVAQGLGAIALQLELAANRDAAHAGQHLGLALQLVRTSMVEVRSFIRNLRTETQQDVELASALEDLLRTATEGTSIEPRFRADGAAYPLPSGIEVQIIRIAQEAVSNAVQHSGASAISLTVHYSPTELLATVSDTGGGFDPTVDWAERMHFGLLGMKERAELISSTLTIDAATGGGTRVILRVPRDAVLKDSLSL